MARLQGISANLNAFLDMIAFSELPQPVQGDDGYNVLVGSTVKSPSLFAGYADHPRVLVKLSPSLSSTAAGRYQILARFFDAYKKQLKLPDFSPVSQDKIAVQLIRECGALPDIDAGRFATALKKCKSRWASLPGAGYGQNENKYESLEAAYKLAGGKVMSV